MSTPTQSVAPIIAGRSYDLGRMDLPTLCRTFATYPTVLLYVGLALASLVVTLSLPFQAWRLALAALLVTLVYPLAWYGLHRFVLHGRWMYRVKALAGLWKRVHFDHHQDPHRMDVLFGSPLNTIPTIAAVTLPIGWLIGGPATAAAAFGTGIVTTCVYEFIHCIQHLNYKPRIAWVARMKQAHLLHHFHDETGNFGIVSFLPDRLFASFYPGARDRARSAHVFNLGYDLQQAQRYPWVMGLTGAAPRDRPARASRASDATDGGVGPA